MKYYLRAANGPQMGNYIAAFTAADNNFVVKYSNEIGSALQLDEPSAKAILSFLDKHKKYFDLVPNEQTQDEIDQSHYDAMQAELIRIRQIARAGQSMPDAERLKLINSFATKALIESGLILDERA